MYKKLLEQAKNVSNNAYAPYSNFKVGACALFEDGNTYCGCNVENSSYGLSLCAERNAISSAISSGQTGKIKAIAIVSPNRKNCFPCGACRQWIAEFNTTNDIDVIIENENSEPIIYKISDLLPNTFLLN